MDEREFIGARQAAWARLEAILQRASGPLALRNLSREELRELGPLYRRAASDLAYARAHAVSPGLIAHINGLAARSYALLYQTDTHSWEGIRAFFGREFPRTFRRRLPFFLASLTCLVVGGLVGYLLVIHSRSNIDIFVPPGSPFRPSLEMWEQGQSSERLHDSAAAATASFLMQNNIRVSFTAFALGILGGVFTVLLIFINGAMLGAFAGDMTWFHQHANFWPGILPHGVVELTETCIAGGAGLALGWALLAPGVYSRRDALVLAARDAARLILGGIALLIFAGLVEAFISHSMLPRPLKLAFGIASGIALYSYLLLTGRSSESGAASRETGDGARDSRLQTRA